jgi:hypothetical protein
MGDFQKINHIIEEKPTLIHFHQLSPFYYANTPEETLIKANQILDIQDLRIVGEK